MFYAYSNWSFDIMEPKIANKREEKRREKKKSLTTPLNLAFIHSLIDLLFEKRFDYAAKKYIIQTMSLIHFSCDLRRADTHIERDFCYAYT